MPDRVAESGLRRLNTCSYTGAALRALINRRNFPRSADNRLPDFAKNVALPQPPPCFSNSDLGVFSALSTAMAENEDIQRLDDTTLGEKANGVTSSTDAPAPVNDEARPDVFSSTVQEILFVSVATMAIAMSSLLNGAITVLTSQVQNDLNMTTAELTWLAGSSSCVIIQIPLLYCSCANTIIQSCFWLVSPLLRQTS